MELVYIWLSEYHEVYKKQGFNFSGRYRFAYDETRHFLEYKENENYVDSFFRLPSRDNESLPSIVNVTAIVGENGAGKTSILEFIKYELVYGRKVRRSEFIAVFTGIDEEGRRRFYVYHHEKIKVAVPEDNSYSLLSFNNERSPGSNLFHIGPDFLKNTTYIFFSPVADQRRNENREKLRLINISTNYLLSHESRTGIANYRHKEIQRQVRFLQHGKQLLAYLPANLRDVLPDHMDLFLQDVSEHEELWETIESLQQRLVNEQIADSVSKYLNELRFQLLKCALVEFFDMVQVDDYNKLNFKYTKSLKGPKLFNHFIGIIKKHLNFIGDGEEARSYERALDAKLALPSLIESYLANGVLKLSKKKIRLEFDKAEEVLDHLEKATFELDIFQYDWKDLSSGQKALLSLCARFFSVLKKNVRSQVCILIDEGEIYLHPQWQKELLYMLIEFLPRLFGNEIKQIQIILTSNSPFVVSDLPSSNVIFLKQDPDRKSQVVDGLEGHAQTFASNVHSLFAHSFFMQDGLMGKFASTKINEAIDLLVNGSREEFRQRHEETRKLIEWIGEPVIRNKLVQMYREKLSLDYLRLEERVRRLEKSLEDGKGPNS